jgi:hypothetical protein
MTYKIFVQTENNGTLVFKNVKEYSEVGSYIKFVDVMTKRTLLYPISKVNIEEETR